MLNINNLYSLQTLTSKIEKLKFPDKLINDFFEDGIENNSLIEISGEAGSGKSNFCMMLMVQAALSKLKGGLDAGVLYLTTTKRFSNTRLDGMLNSLGLKKAELTLIYAKMHIMNLEATDFDNFMSHIDDFIFKNKIKMIVIDSITGLSDVQFINENNEVDYVGRAQFLKRILILFKQLISNYNLFFIVTNNVKGDIDKGNGKSVPSLGLIWENGVNTRIILHKNEYSRQIEILFSNYLSYNKSEFKITDSGIQILN